MRFTYCLVGASLLLTLGVATTAQGATLYAASYATDSLWMIDTQAGSVTEIGAFGVNFTEGDLAFNSAGELYGAFAGSLDQLYTIDPGTGAASLVGPFNFMSTSDVSGLAFDSADTLFGLDSDNNALLTIDAGTGAGTLFGDGDTKIADIGALAGMSFASDGTLYTVDSMSDSLYAFQNLGAGDATADDATFVDTLGTLSWTSGMTFALDGAQMKLYVVDDTWPSQLYTIDLGTMIVAPVPLIDSLPDGIGGLAWVIPEPATLALLGLGSLLLLRSRRHKL